MGKPEIRFKGYTDEWEQRKLIDLVDVLDGDRGKNYPTSDDFDISGHTLFLNASNVTNDGFLFQDNQFITEEKSNSMGNGKLEEDDIVVTSRGSLGHIAWYNADISSFVPYARINSGMLILRNKKEIETEYLYHFMKSSKGQSQISFISFGSAQPQLTKKGVEDLEVILPTRRDEQVQLGHYFSNLDHLITLHQRKCDEAKSLKKYMLQKMFPQNEQKVPEIRFEGFTEAWEQRKLGDWGNFYYGRSCPKWSVTEDATIPCIRYGELYTKFGAKIDRVYSYTNMPPENLRFSKGTEVLIPRVGEDPMDYNHCTWLSMQDVAIGEMISVFNTDNNPLFTATMFNATLQNEFAMRVEGGSVTNLYFEKLKNIDVSFPSIPEQEKIAAYFENLDHLITLHQQKCEELKKIKKFMLQKMFV